MEVEKWERYPTRFYTYADRSLAVRGVCSMTYFLSSLTGLGTSCAWCPTDESVGYFLSPCRAGIRHRTCAQNHLVGDHYCRRWDARISSSVSGVLGQSFFSSKDSERSARSLPPV